MMRWCLVITLAVVCLNAATARPSDGVEWQAAGLQAWPYVAAYPTYPIQQANAQILLDPYYNAATNLVPIAYNGVPVYQAPVQLVSGQVTATPMNQKKTMAKATAEPTTPSPAQRPAVLRSGSDKLRNAATQTPKNTASTASQSTVMDLQYLRAVQQPNTQFVVEKIIPVPGTRLYQPPTLETANQRTALPATARPNLAAQKKSNAKQTFDQNSEEDDSQVVVSATGHTATGQPIPEIPIGTFFSPYFGVLAEPNSNQKQASLILEPHAKSIVGNGGTAIATPVSHAILKKGVPARVLFRPQSVAVAGVGGTAHAQADLILDYVDRK